MKPLTLDDKNIFNDYLKKFPPQISEYTFTNLYMWNHHYNIHYEVLNNCLCLVSEQKQTIILPPIGNDQDIIKAFDQIYKKYTKKDTTMILERFPEPLAKKLKEIYQIDLQPDEDNFDYVYNSQNLIKLSGRKYHGQKNHVNRFKREYKYTLEELNKNNARDCLEFTEYWLNEKDISSNPGLLHEYKSIKTFFENFDAFNVKGLVIKINRKVEAYTFGELLNPETAVVHIEKANPEIPDLYAFINQCFVEQMWSDIPYINREQDMGIPGLRKAKQSYHPVKMVYKYKGTITP